MGRQPFDASDTAFLGPTLVIGGTLTILAGVEPIPESRELVDEFGPFIEGDLLAELSQQAELVRALVPSCVGLSVAVLQDGMAVTLVATDEHIGALDAVQYVHNGPCVEAVHGDQPIAATHVDMLEYEWTLFASATAAAGIRSTLSLPVITDGHVTGSVNLYATTSTAFDGHHEAVATILGAWAPGAVSNADLTFSTRQTAREAPALHRAELAVIRATALLATELGLDLETAGARMTLAAGRAGVAVEVVARMVIDTHSESSS